MNPPGDTTSPIPYDSSSTYFSPRTSPALQPRKRAASADMDYADIVFVPDFSPPFPTEPSQEENNTSESHPSGTAIATAIESRPEPNAWHQAQSAPEDEALYERMRSKRLHAAKCQRLKVKLLQTAVCGDDDVESNRDESRGDNIANVLLSSWTNMPASLADIKVY